MKMGIDQEATKGSEEAGNIPRAMSLNDLIMKQSEALKLMDQYEGDCQSIDKTGSSTEFESLGESMDVFNLPEELEFSPMKKVSLEVSPTSVTSMSPFDSSFYQGIEKVLDFDESEDIDSTRLSVDGSDSELQAAINEIRKEASQIDIVLAL